MDGTHDLGGLQGFGPVVTEGPAERPFHAPWEGRVHGVMLTLLFSGQLRGSMRHAIERMGAVDYLETSYYEHWLAAIETLLAEGGAIDRSVWEARLAEGRTTPAVRHDPELAERVRSVLGGTRRRSWEGPAHRFAVGDRVRARADVTTHGGHTRCPRYVRGAIGTVDRRLPLEPLPEGLPERRIVPVPCYTIAFESLVLWGPDAERFTVTVDLVEPYLEAAP